ncbi:MAG: hypothetical protein JXB49_01960 [Bacteroidales bacterium]|nr:hypothetical protein [Bacteroidales bacterium]
MRRFLFQLIGLIICISSYAQIKVACVGNSITYGYGIEGRDSLAYPGQLASILGDGWEVKNFGNSGATLLKKGNKPYWNLPEFIMVQDYNPDVIIIKLGTNDSKPCNWDKYGDEFVSDYKEMIHIFQNMDSHPIVYVAIPIMVVKDTWTIRKKVVEEDISALIKNIAGEGKLPIIDFYSALKDYPELIPDNVHPNAAGSEIMARTAAKVLLKDKEKIQTR